MRVCLVRKLSNCLSAHKFLNFNVNAYSLRGSVGSSRQSVHLDFMPLVHLDSNSTSGSSRIFSYLQFIQIHHTSGSSRLHTSTSSRLKFIYLVHLDFIPSPHLDRNSYIWFIQTNFKVKCCQLWSAKLQILDQEGQQIC